MYNFVVLETNSLAPLTINSILRHMPDAIINRVQPGDSMIGAALSATNLPSFVLRSGVVFRATLSQIPVSRLHRNPIAITDQCVFKDHPTLENGYSMMDSSLVPNTADLSVFHIVPQLWKRTPERDTGVLANSRKMWMPRYMNHKTDVLVEGFINAKEALFYGALGVPALVLNYVPNLVSGEANPSEQSAYCFDHLAPYMSGLDRSDRDRIQILVEKTTTRYAKMRDAFANLSGLKNAKANL